MIRSTGPARLLLAMASVALLAVPARAQGTGRAPILLELPASTRALGLGGAFVPVGGEPDAIFHNPALLRSARGIAAAVQRYRGSSTLASVSAAIEMAPGGLGVGVQRLEYGADPDDLTGAGRGPAALLRRGPVLATDLVASVGYARPIGGVRVGAAAKVIEHQAGNARDHAAAVDLGAAIEVRWVTLALAVQNLGDAIEVGDRRYDLPRRVVLAAGHPSRIVGPFDLVTTGAVAVADDGTVAPAIGAELAWWPVVGKTFVGRIGFRRTTRDGERPVTLGGGFIGDRFSIDYAYEAFGGPGGAHRFGIGWR
jgi:hypothetical protein